jgi:hypothetical protein
MKPLVKTLIDYIKDDGSVTVLSELKRSVQSVTYTMNNFTAPQVAILEPIRDAIQSGCSFTDDDMKQLIHWGTLIRGKVKQQWKTNQDTKADGYDEQVDAAIESVKAALMNKEFSDTSALDKIIARATTMKEGV